MMEHKGTVLLVEDNKQLNFANGQALKMRGYAVLAAENLAEAREHLSQTDPDVILLDVMLPDGDGFDFCGEIRDKTKARVIFLTAKDDHADKIRGLTGGGDDYITKPFHAEEMLARVDIAIRQKSAEKTPPQSIAKGSLTLDIISGRAYIGGKDLQLQPKDFALLHLLLLSEGKDMTLDELYEKVWGQPMVGDNTSVQRIVSRLRKSIEPIGYTISSIYGKGYVFERL
jgi:DNA-binding response OmpR family regulator